MKLSQLSYSCNSLAIYLCQARLSPLYDQLLQGSWMMLSADRLGVDAADARRRSAHANYNLRHELRAHGYGWADARLMVSRSLEKFEVGQHLVFVPGLLRQEILMLGARYAIAHQAVLWGDQGRFAKVPLDRSALDCPLDELMSDWFVEQTLVNQNDCSNNPASVSIVANGRARLIDPDAERILGAFCVQSGYPDLGVVRSAAIYSLADAKDLDVRSLRAYLPFQYLAPSDEGIVSP